MGILGPWERVTSVFRGGQQHPAAGTLAVPDFLPHPHFYIFPPSSNMTEVGGPGGPADWGHVPCFPVQGVAS